MVAEAAAARHTAEPKHPSCLAAATIGSNGTGGDHSWRNADKDARVSTPQSQTIRMETHEEDHCSLRIRDPVWFRACFRGGRVEQQSAELNIGGFAPAPEEQMTPEPSVRSDASLINRFLDRFLRLSGRHLCVALHRLHIPLRLSLAGAGGLSNLFLCLADCLVGVAFSFVGGATHVLLHRFDKGTVAEPMFRMREM